MGGLMVMGKLCFVAQIYAPCGAKNWARVS